LISHKTFVVGGDRGLRESAQQTEHVGAIPEAAYIARFLVIGPVRQTLAGTQ
jgi:hypothetical protein